MADLVLGPLLRHVDGDSATVWVEVDAPCTVEVGARPSPGSPTPAPARERTFAVEGHHYALAHWEGLPTGATLAYEVRLDGKRVWPRSPDAGPPSLVRTLDPDRPTVIAFGSCRMCAPHGPPYSLTADEHPEGLEVDALRALALRMHDDPPEAWPDALLLLGDQVYADYVSPCTRAFLRARRDVAQPPGETVADFEEYSQLYREAWSEPELRWLLSTLPTAMIFDDHDVHDDWNTSAAWVRDMRATGWWEERIVGAFMSYWLYQHLGNLSPADLAEDPLWAKVRACAGDAGPILRDFAWRADREAQGARWSFARDIGPARLVMIDSRAGRVLAPERTMVDEQEWAWIEDQLRGGVDHLLVGTSLPLWLAPGMHYLEAWNEALCEGAWGAPGAWLGEKLRQGLDLEHWAAFGDSFTRMCALLEGVAAGERGEAPASIVALSGDVHHAYLAEVAFPRGNGASGASGGRAPVWQAVCSPLRNPLDGHERRGIRFACSRPATAIGRALARTAGVGDPPVRWRFAHDEPWFDNQVATLVLDGRRATFHLEKALPVHADGDAGHLEQVFARSLTAPA